MSAGGTNQNVTITPSGTGEIVMPSGNVGIGTSNPGALLQVGVASDQSFKVGVSSNTANANAEVSGSIAAVDTNAGSITSNGAVAWNFYNNGNSPSWSGALLEYFGTAMTGTSYGLPQANQGTLVFQNVSSGVIGSNGAPIFISPNSIISTTFLTNGNVGIGTTSPGSALTVTGQASAMGGILTNPQGDLSMGSFTAGPLPQ